MCMLLVDGELIELSISDLHYKFIAPLFTIDKVLTALVIFQWGIGWRIMEYVWEYVHIMNEHADFLHKKISAMHNNIDEPKGYYAKMDKSNIIEHCIIACK